MPKMNEIMFGYELAAFDARAQLVARERRGVQHRHRISPAVPQAGDTPTITVEVEVDQTIAQVRCVLKEPEAHVIPLRLVETVWDALNWRYVQVWEATLPAYPKGTVVKYTVEALPRDGSASIPAEGGEIFSYLVGTSPPPDWAAEARIYQIFVDRFHPGTERDWNPTASLHDVFGGTLRGIIEKLDYLADLGINCLWLTPIFPDDTPHGYRATDYFSVNLRVGTLEDARTLVREAHARGIRLLLDFVANHISDQHPAFLKAQADRVSAEYKWFTWRKWPDDYETYFNVRAMPKINTDHPGARAYLLRSIRFWLEDVGFDGLRLDHANGPSHDFWTAVRALIMAIKPEAWIFGEVVAPPPVLRSYAGRLHGVLDFPLAQALRDTFAFSTMSLQAFDAFLSNHEYYFPDTFNLPSFLDNHDMDRFLYIAGGDVRKLKLAALCLFTLGGPPILYAGTELGLSQQRAINEPGSAGMDECRLPMPWDNPLYPDLHAFFRELFHFRREHPVLWQGERRTVHVDDVTQTYAYVCFDEGDEHIHDAVLVALNRSEEAQSIALGNITVELAPLSGDTCVLNIAQRQQLLGAKM